MVKQKLNFSTTDMAEQISKAANECKKVISLSKCFTGDDEMIERITAFSDLCTKIRFLSPSDDLVVADQSSL